MPAGTRQTDQTSFPEPLDSRSEHDTSLTSETSFHSQKASIKGGQALTEKDNHMDLQRSLALVALTLCYVGSQITSFFGGPALNYIAADLGIGQERSWITNCSNVATASIVPVSGYIQDLIGRRGSLAAGLALFMIGIIINATAHSFVQLLVGGVIGGIGNGIQELAAVASVADLVSARKRGLYLGLMVASTVIFSPSLLYASELSTHASWRWLYWIALIWNAVAALMTAATYFTMKIQRFAPEAPPARFRDFDFVGAALLLTGVIEILVAVSSGGSSHPWNSAYVLVQLVLGIVLLILLVVWESFGFGRPLIPFRLFKGQRVVGIVFVICVFSGATYSSYISLGPTIIEEVFQLPILTTGILSIASPLGVTTGAFIVNSLLTAFRGKARELLLVSAVIMTAFAGAEASVSAGDYTNWTIFGAFFGLGLGGVLVPLITIVSIACPQDLIGVAIGLVICIRTLGGSIGYAIQYSIYMNEINAHSARIIVESAVHDGLPVSQAMSLASAFLHSQDPTAPNLGLDVTSNRTILANAHFAFEEGAANAARLVYYTTIAFGGVIIVCAAFLPDMDRFLSDRVLSVAVEPLGEQQKPAEEVA